MTSPVGLLDFFIVEATDYIDRLDALLGSAPGSGPDGDALLRHARMLRGSATMARQSGMADVAGGLERVARAVRDRTLRWDQQLAASFVAAVDDLKLLLRAVRAWSSTDERRAQTRVAELNRLVPDAARAPSATPASTGGNAFLAAETAAIAEAIERLARQPGDERLLGTALGKVRALRGVAAIRDLPPLAEVVDAIERAAKPLELGAAPPSAPQIELFHAASALLRHSSIEIASGRRPDVNSSEIERFAAAASALADEGGEADRIVPIAELFYSDGGPHVVSTAPNPPTSPAQRFRLEVVSQAEHLRRLLADARQARDAASRGRLARELRAAFRALGSAAESFSEGKVARLIASLAKSVVSMTPPALASAEELAILLADPATRTDELARRLDRLEANPPVAAAQVPEAPAPSGTTAPASEPPRGRVFTPTGRELLDFLNVGIAGIGRLHDNPLSAPVPLPDEAIIPIEQLLYSGRAALERAIEIRAEIRQRGTAPSEDAMNELFDLLDLALAE